MGVNQTFLLEIFIWYIFNGWNFYSTLSTWFPSYPTVGFGKPTLDLCQGSLEVEEDIEVLGPPIFMGSFKG
jgi:hypothetical protein